MDTGYSLHFHIPFCVHRCAYCDFNTYAGREALIPAYVDALAKETNLVGRSPDKPLPVRTIFFGGGTPSLLSGSQFEIILRAVHECFSLPAPEEMETSLEANPGTVTLDGLRELRRLGFTRVSFGVQSAHPDELRQLERIHDFFDVIDSVKWARQAGFGNLNLDLIYGLPEQTLPRWQDSLRRIVRLDPEHLSLYALTLEGGTPFGRWSTRGLMPLPDPDLAADMYEWASDFLEGEGYEQYEISNWSKPGYQCRHNLQYWRNQPYLGLGAGAHGFANGVRYSNVLWIKSYIDREAKGNSRLPFPLTPETVNHQAISRRVEMQETMLTGLRLTKEGVSEARFQNRFGAGLMDVFGREIDELVGLGLLEWVTAGPTELDLLILRLTRRGRLLGNQVFMRFVGD